MGKIQCSVGILTYNSAGTLERTLNAVKDFAEIIVCDGGSADETLNIAKGFGCKIIFQDQKFKRDDGKIKDFAGVRNQTLDAASHRWFFYIDSDELLSLELIKEISEVVIQSKPAAFWIPRKYVINDLIIDCATTYPSKQMRLFHLDVVGRFIKTIHERIEVKEIATVSSLRNFMLIPMTTDISTIRKKWDYYIDLEGARRNDLSLWQWLQICAENFKISILYAFRFFRNLFFCSGNRMPFTLEMQRHIYHINLSRRLFWKIRKIY